MIQQNPTTWQPLDWQSALSDLVTDLGELAQALALDLGDVQAATQDFPLRLPRTLLNRIKPGDLKDPVLLQCLPQADELVSTPGFSTDPLQETDKNPVRGIIRKFHNRALVTLTQSCAIHCRYCFRRHFNYRDNLPGKKHVQAMLDYLMADPNLEEVILSGGDPLTVNDEYFAWLIAQLSTIPHLKTLRIHTRLPIIIPQRVTKALINTLEQSRFHCVMVLHSNHAQEIDVEVKAACQRLRAAGITLLNQSVLLKGINDTAETQVDLAKTLFDAGVLPYYLHVLDPVQGAAHFYVDDDTGIKIIRAMEAALQGYLVPRLVREVPGASAKVRLA